MRIIRPTSKEMEKIVRRGTQWKTRIRKKVGKILEDVRLYGDDALIKYIKEFEESPLSIRQLRVKESEINRAYQIIDSKFIAVLKSVIENMNRFYRKQNRGLVKLPGEDGVMLGERHSPVNTVGVYIPGGTAPLVSTVCMTVIPARIAKVKRIIMVTPPDKFQRVNPYILVIANLLKVDEIYKVGGAQAIAALAFGTKTIPRVDKITGPGNEYVTEAKRQVFGHVGIDLVAGPSEIAIIAGKEADVKCVTADLKAQCEHAKGCCFLITTSRELADTVRKELKSGYCILVKSLKEAAEVANAIAPEHLEIFSSKPEEVARHIQNAGAILLGQYSPAVLGDYIAGPSHVLPTGGTARFFSALGVEDFMKRTHMIKYSKKALEKARDKIKAIASLEGMEEHIKSVDARF